MALVVKDRVKETTSTTGTGTLTLGGAVTGFQTFTSVLSNSDTTYYAIFESSTGQFEVGLGTFTSSGTTLARTTVLESSNSGNAINLTAGAADVFITQPAEKSVYLDSSGHIAAADGRNVTNVAASTATTAATVTTAAQPNITSLGTLTGLDINGDLNAVDNVIVASTVQHEGDSNTYLGFGTDNVELVAGGTQRLLANSSGVTINDITINGSTISDGADFTIDVGGVMSLDANGGNIRFKNNGTQFGTIYQSSSHLVFQSDTSDGDIILQGNDGGSYVNALTLDMSDAGTAIFNHDVKVNDNSKFFAGTSGDLQIFHDGSNSKILDGGTGNLHVLGDNEIYIANANNTEYKARFITDGAVELYYDSAKKFETTSTGVDISGDLNAVDNIVLATAMYHEGDTDTLMSFGTDQIAFNTGGSTRLNLSNSGVTINDITISGSTISDAADLTFDVGGDIILDADGGDVFLKDGGTQFGKIANGGTNAELHSNAHLSLRPNNGTSATSNTVWNQGNVAPWVNDYFTLGNSSYGWQSLWLSSGIYHQGDDDTYLQFDAANSFRIVAGNTETFKTTASDITISANLKVEDHVLQVGDISSDNYLELKQDYADGRGFTYQHDNASVFHNLQGSLTQHMVLGDSDPSSTETLFGISIYQSSYYPRFKVSGNGNVNIYNDLDIDGNLNAVDNIYVADKIYHEGDTDTYMGFGTDEVTFYTAGTLGFAVSSSWLSMQAPNYNYYNYFDESSQLTGTTPTINAANSGVFYITLSGNTTFTFTNTSSGWGVGFILYLTGNGSTVTWPGTVDWAGGTAPDAPANGETDVLVFTTRDGSNWFGALAIDAAG